MTVSDVGIIVPWLVLNNTGQWCLLLLLITYASARHLPQRNNAYLVNFTLTTFLATIPPSILFYSGYQYLQLPRSLCIAQYSLVAGISPMFATAQLALVFDTWSELRSLSIHKRHVSRLSFVKCVALVAPYFVLGIWTLAGFKAALSTSYFNPDMLPPANYVYCRSPGDAANHVSKSVGLFLSIAAIIQVILEIWVAWMIYAYPSKVHDDPTAWRTSIQFSARVMALSFMQFLAVLLSIINDSPGQHHDPTKRAYELLDSMNALAVFLIVGAQTNVLLTWKSALLRFCSILWSLANCHMPARHNDDDDGNGDTDTEELQPHGYPVHPWAYAPSSPPTKNKILSKPKPKSKSKSFDPAVAPFDAYYPFDNASINNNKNNSNSNYMDLDLDAAEKGKGPRRAGGGGGGDGAGAGGALKQMLLKTKIAYPKMAALRLGSRR